MKDKDINCVCINEDGKNKFLNENTIFRKSETKGGEYQLFIKMCQNVGWSEAEIRQCLIQKNTWTLNERKTVTTKGELIAHFIKDLINSAAWNKGTRN